MKTAITSFIGIAGALMVALSPAAISADVNPVKAGGKSTLDKAYFAGGCFWKTQYVFSKVPGVIKTKAGYTGGTLKSPTYEQVSSHTTGHAEAVEVDYDPKKVSYHKLLETFFANHDPTTLNRQGPDVGSNYRSAIFFANPEQQSEATAYKDELERAHKFSKPIVTEIKPATQFYDAEEYHQNYFAKHGAVCD